MIDRPIYALLGAPVHHSLSPALQNAAFKALEIDAVYVALWAWDDLVSPFMRSLPGGNVTLPHKRTAARALDHAEQGRLSRCDGCGGSIPLTRLRAVPGTTLCVACARAQETGA